MIGIVAMLPWRCRLVRGDCSSAWPRCVLTRRPFRAMRQVVVADRKTNKMLLVQIIQRRIVEIGISAGRIEFMEHSTVLDHSEVGAKTPKARYHCSSCRRVTLVALGQTEAVCTFCGLRITETYFALDQWRAALGKRPGACSMGLYGF
jgi:DNA-directed RNA polymerase subunit RPC12/RpoP